MQIVLCNKKDDTAISVSHDDVKRTYEVVEYEKRHTVVELKDSSRFKVKQSSYEISEMVNYCFAVEQGRC